MGTSFMKGLKSIVDYSTKHINVDKLEFYLNINKNKNDENLYLYDLVIKNHILSNINAANALTLDRAINLALLNIKDINPEDKEKLKNYIINASNNYKYLL